MAVIPKQGRPSLSSLTPPSNEVISGLRAGENLAAGDLCVVKANGTVMKRTTETIGLGIATDHDRSAGESVTLYRNVRVAYGAGLTPGTAVYAGTGGALDDAGTDDPIGFVVDATRIQFTGL